MALIYFQSERIITNVFRFIGSRVSTWPKLLKCLANVHILYIVHERGKKRTF